MSIETYKTRYGTVFHSSTCKDDWKNIRTRPTRKRFMGHGSEIPFTALTLQGPALESIKAIEKDISGPWKKEFVRATGTIRTCALQWQLYNSDHERYAHPNTTLHTQGLAIDVHTDFLTPKLKAAFLAHGWHQSRPDDEPWHFSFRLTA